MAERLALQRDEDLVGGGETVDGQDPERRWTVDEHDVEAVADGVERARQSVLPSGAGEEVDLRPREVDRRRQHREVSQIDHDIAWRRHDRSSTWWSDVLRPSGSRPNE